MKKNKIKKIFSKFNSNISSFQILKFFAIGILLFGTSGFLNSASADSSDCEAQPGNYCTTDDIVTYCPEGTYQDLEGKNFCKIAPFGTFVTGTGATSFTKIDEGYLVGKKWKKNEDYYNLNQSKYSDLNDFFSDNSENTISDSTLLEIFQQYLLKNDGGLSGILDSVGLSDKNSVLSKNTECDFTQGYGGENCTKDYDNWKKYKVGTNLSDWQDDNGKFKFLNKDTFELTIVPKGYFLNSEKDLKACPEGTYQDSEGSNSCIHFAWSNKKGFKIKSDKTGLEQCQDIPSTSFFSGICEFTCNAGYAGEKCDSIADGYISDSNSLPVLKEDFLNEKVKDFKTAVRNSNKALLDNPEINFDRYSQKSVYISNKLISFDEIKNEIEDYYSNDRLKTYGANVNFLSNLDEKVSDYNKFLLEGTGSLSLLVENRKKINEINNSGSVIFDKFNYADTETITDEMIKYDFTENISLMNISSEDLKGNFTLIKSSKKNMDNTKTDIQKIYSDFKANKISLYGKLQKEFNDSKDILESNFSEDSIDFLTPSNFNIGESDSNKIVFYYNNFSEKYINTEKDYLNLVNSYFEKQVNANIQGFTGATNFNNLVKSYTGKILDIKNKKDIFSGSGKTFSDLEFTFLSSDGNINNDGIGKFELDSFSSELLIQRDNISESIKELNLISEKIENEFKIFNDFCNKDDICYGIKNPITTDTTNLYNVTDVTPVTNFLEDRRKFLRSNKDDGVKTAPAALTGEIDSTSVDDFVKLGMNSSFTQNNLPKNTTSEDDITKDTLITTLVSNISDSKEVGIEDVLKESTEKVVEYTKNINSTDKLSGIFDIQDKINILKGQLLTIKQLELNFENKNKILGCEPGVSIEKDGIKYAGPDGVIPCSISYFKKYTKEQKQNILDGFYSLISSYDSKFADFSKTIIETSDEKNILIDGSGSLICKAGMVEIGNGCVDLSKINIKGIAYGSDAGPIIMDPFKCSEFNGSSYGPNSKNYQTSRECYIGENGFRLSNSGSNIEMEGIIYSPEVGPIKFGGISVLYAGMNNLSNNFEYNIDKSIDIENQIIADKIFNLNISSNFFENKGFSKTGSKSITKENLDSEFESAESLGLFSGLYGVKEDRILDIKNKTVTNFNRQLETLRAEYSNLGFAQKVLDKITDKNFTFNESNSKLQYFTEELVRRVVGYGKIDSYSDGMPGLSDFRNDLGIGQVYPVLLSSYLTSSNYDYIKDDLYEAIKNIKNSKDDILLGKGTGSGLIANINSQDKDLSSYISTGSVVGNNLREKILDTRNKINTIKRQLKFLFEEDKNIDSIGEIQGCFDGEYLIKEGIKYSGNDGVTPCSKRVFKNETEKIKMENIERLSLLTEFYNDTLLTYILNANKNLNGKGNIDVTGDGEADKCSNGAAILGHGCTYPGGVNINGLAYGSDSGPIVMDPFKCSVKSGSYYGPASKKYISAKSCYEGEEGLRLTILKGRMKLSGIVYSPEVGPIKFGEINKDVDVELETIK